MPLAPKSKQPQPAGESMLKVSVTAWYALITFLTVGLLVLLRMDGLSDKTVMLVGFVALGPSAILFRFAHANPKSRKWLERYSGAVFVALAIAHLVIDKS